jgi:tol-pal system protein YbgF
MFALVARDPYDFGAVTTTRLICILMLPAFGCATPMSSLREDNHRLEQSVVELRADRRAQEHKLRDLEHQLALAKEKQTSDVPQLPVEVIAPASAAAPAAATNLPAGARMVGVADDGGEILYEGDAAAGKVATIEDDSMATTSFSSRRVAHVEHLPPPSQQIDDASIASASTGDRIEVTHHVPLAARASRGHVRDVAPTAAPAPAPVPMSSEGAVGDYRAAVELVKAGKYEPAVDALHAFLAKYPKHDYADNAQYWLGEAFYAQKDFQHALTEFRATIESYPRGNKVPDALLKLGYCYQALGQTDKAHAVLEQVVNLYPKSEPAALAAKRLESK